MRTGPGLQFGQSREGEERGPDSAAAKRSGPRLGLRGMSTGGGGCDTAGVTPRAMSASSPGVRTAEQEFCYRR